MDPEKLEKIKILREITRLPLQDCKKILEEANFDLEAAKEKAKNLGAKFFQKKEKQTKAGIVFTYLHPNKKIGVILELSCESDFVAQTQEFEQLAKELCLQIAALGKEETELLEQNWIKDESLKIKDLISLFSKKLGEKIEIKRYCRYQVGEN